MKAVAQTPTSLLAWDGDRAHDLAHVRELAEVMAATSRPRPEVVGLRVELVGPRVQPRAYRP